VLALLDARHERADVEGIGAERPRGDLPVKDSAVMSAL
jgi:hypothetical protein